MDTPLPFDPDLARACEPTRSKLAPAMGTRLPYCQACNRRITNPDSQRLGYGPVCAEKNGVAASGGGSASFPRHTVRGSRGATHPCLKALGRLFDTDKKPTRVILVTFQDDDGYEDMHRHLWSHGFLVLLASGRWEIVADGFASGYGGTGPRGLAEALALMTAAGIVPEVVQLASEAAAALFVGELAIEPVVAAAETLHVEIVSDPTINWATYHPTHGQAHARLVARPAVYREPPRQLSLLEE